VGVFGTHGPLSRLNESLTQPSITLARGAANLFARALMVAWTDADPRGQMPCCGKTLHVGSHFGKENLGNTLVDARDTIQQSYGLLIRQRHLWPILRLTLLSKRRFSSTWCGRNACLVLQLLV